MKVKQFSPFVIDFEIVAKGNMKRKAKISNIWNEIQPQSMFNTPIIKVKKTNKKSQPTKPLVKESIEFDTKGLVH